MGNCPIYLMEGVRRVPTKDFLSLALALNKLSSELLCKY